MNKDEHSIVLRQKVRKFAELAKSKNYRIETIKSACIIAGSKEMHDNYGDTLKALDKVIELCEKCNNTGEFLQEVLALAGIE